MTWFKVDDGFYDHPKVAQLPNAAIGLWAKAGSFCGKHLTDGVISAQQVRALKGTKSQIDALISAGLWDQIETDSGTKSYSFRNWVEYQPTRESVEKQRDEWAEKKRKSRDKKGHNQHNSKNVPEGVTEMSPSRTFEGVTEMSGTIPDPSRPVPTNKDINTLDHSPNDHVSKYPPAFENWWQHYPKKVGKRKALNEWKRAMTRITNEELIEATKRFAAFHAQEQTDKQFIKDPQGWLSRDGWHDELISRRTQQPKQRSAFEVLMDMEQQPAPIVEGEWF